MKTNPILLKIIVLSLLILPSCLVAQEMRQETYCNPLDLDYTYMIYNSGNDISYRSGADPAVVEFRGEYYMFVTRSHGYWHSTDLLHWNFITPENWYFAGSNAPAAHNYKDSVLYVTGDPSGTMNIIYTDNPKKGDWKGLPGILYDLQDPDLFIDDDGQAYMFWGSSNVFPIRGRKLNREKHFHPEGDVVELFHLNGDEHGWERFGENHSDTILSGYMEGAWLTKHNGTYYMQYGAPGTEFNVYGDGVYVAKEPLGPYTYQRHNPVTYKPGGFMNGAGHGSTVIGPGGNYWHFATMAYSINVNWERRICMFPLAFDKEGIMYSDTRFGDYPRYAPDVPSLYGQFRGWMLLSYKKPVKASSTLEDFEAAGVTDERVKTFWVAQGKDSDEWLEIDLEKPASLYALQLNFHDYKSDLYGRYPNLRHRYLVEGSLDKEEWSVLVDRSQSYRDTPNGYVELDSPQRVRYVRYRNIEVPTPYLSLAEFRLFGTGEGKKPNAVKELNVIRKEDRRDAQIEWSPVKNAQGYHVLWGIAKDKLYNSWLVYDKNELLLKSLSTQETYYFSVEAFNENGVAKRSPIVKVN